MAKSIMSNEKVCFICGSPNELHRHHIFYGANRWVSEREGCWCYLCRRHHIQSSVAVHENHEMDLELKQQCQRTWMDRHQASEDDFRKVFHRSYL